MNKVVEKGPSITSVKDVRKRSIHTNTMGAFVQQPTPSIVGVEENKIITSQDAKSLYPTIMALLNIGFDTLYARVYDYEIVEGFFNLMIYYFKNKTPKVKETIFEKITSAFKTLLDNYCKREKPQNKKELIEFNLKYYTVLLTRVMDYEFDFEYILKPQGTREYLLLKSCLFPILEFMNWTSEKNKKYSKTITDRLFHNEMAIQTSSGIIETNIYKNTYKDKKFYMFLDINSSKTTFNILNFEEAEKILSTYLLTPYGTIFYNQKQKKSFSVDIIINDMEGRAKVKGKMLILDAIITNWNSLTEDEKNSFVIELNSLDKEIAKSVILKIGDSNENKRNWQLENLNSIVFDTNNTRYKNSIDKHKNILNQLNIMKEQLDVEQNGIKTSLNSDYGIFAMIAWEFANFLISNSITTGGKVLGTNLFQQIAKNVLNREELNMKRTLELNNDLK